jgi:hypothetical protein
MRATYICIYGAKTDMTELNRNQAITLIKFLEFKLSDPACSVIDLDDAKLRVRPTIVTQAPPLGSSGSTVDSLLYEKLKKRFNDVAPCFDQLTDEQYGDWLDSLSFEEFTVLIHLSAEQKSE